MFTVLPNLFSFIGKKSGLSQNAIINSNLNTAPSGKDDSIGKSGSTANFVSKCLCLCQDDFGQPLH